MDMQYANHPRKKIFLYVFPGTGFQGSKPFMWVLKSNMEDLTSSETGVKPEVYMYH